MDVGPPRIALVDDHPLVRKGLAELLVDELGALIVFSGADPAGIADLEPLPDLLLLDLDLGQATADPDDVSTLLAAGVRVLVVSAMGSARAVRAMITAGVAGFVGKQQSNEVLLEAITAVLSDGVWTGSEVAAAIAGDPGRPMLSPQEERVLALYASGLKIETVARRTHISVGTAKTYLKRIRAKYADVGRPTHTKTDLYREAVRDGFVEE